MKNILLIMICWLGASGYAFSQVHNGMVKKAVKEIETEKSMNRQQTILNYLQLVGKNLTGNDKGVEFKANLFTLNSKDSVDKYASKYYLKRFFQRNTQIALGGGMDKNNKFSSFSAGFSYNLLNLRDPSEHNLSDELQNNVKYIKIRDELLKISNTVISEYKNETKNKIDSALKSTIQTARDEKTFKTDTVLIRKGVMSLLTKKQQAVALTDPGFLRAYNAFIKAVLGTRNAQIFDLNSNKPVLEELTGLILSDYYISPLIKSMKTYMDEAAKEDGKPKNTDVNVSEDYFNKAIDMMNVEIKKSTSLYSATDIQGTYGALDKIYSDKIKLILRKPLLTLNYNYQYSSNGIPHQHTPSLQFLKGFGKEGQRKTVELNITATDTIASDTTTTSKSLKRNVGNLQIGINGILLTDQSSASLLEAKFALEESIVFSGRRLNEKKDAFYASLTLQGRPSVKSPWLKVMVKYNKDAHFLGFLDVTFNLDNPK